MLTVLDHIVLICPDIETSVADYAKLLGAQPSWCSQTNNTATAVFSFENTSLELLAPTGEGRESDKLRAMTGDSAKLSTLVYRSDSIAQDHRLLLRRGLNPSDITDGSSDDYNTGKSRQWQSFRIPDEIMAGVKTFVLQPQETPETLSAGAGSAGAGSAENDAVSALDHLVIQTPCPDRFVANYGARLGLRLALDRTAEQWNTRFLFFRIGGCTIEAIHRLDETHDSADMDKIWGLTWAVQNLETAHIRLRQADIDVSEIRDGRKPGSRVFTVRNGTLGIPTLFIAHAGR